MIRSGKFFVQQVFDAGSEPVQTVHDSIGEAAATVAQCGVFMRESVALFDENGVALAVVGEPSAHTFDAPVQKA